jgi:hypothetical protein
MTDDESPKPDQPPNLTPMVRQILNLNAKLEESQARYNQLLMLGEPWPLRSVVGRLSEATSHLLLGHSCDAHGHEGAKYALEAAAAWMRMYDSNEPAPLLGLKSYEYALARTIIKFLRANFRNDGEEGESVWKVCELLEKCMPKEG